MDLFSFSMSSEVGLPSFFAQSILNSMSRELYTENIEGFNMLVDKFFTTKSSARLTDQKDWTTESTEDTEKNKQNQYDTKKSSQKNKKMNISSTESTEEKDLKSADKEGLISDWFCI